MSTTTDIVGECECVCARVCVCGVFSYNTSFSCLCHAVHMLLCTNLLSVHATVIPFVC